MAPMRRARAAMALLVAASLALTATAAAAAAATNTSAKNKAAATATLNKPAADVVVAKKNAAAKNAAAAPAKNAAAPAKNAAAPAKNAAAAPAKNVAVVPVASSSKTVAPLTAAPASAPTTRPMAPLASSAILFYTKEYSEPQFGEAKTRCEQLVDNARLESGSDAINFVPTIYFEDDGAAPMGTPAAKEGPRAGCKLNNWATVADVGHFCFKRTWDAPCAAPSAAEVDEFAQGFARCVLAARKAGFKKILMSPHIDDALNKGLWRNMVDFHPLKADTKGNSYWSVLLGPIVQASARAAAAADKEAKDDFTVLLGLQGEMGRPVFSDPAAWSDAATKSRETWKAAGAPSSGLQVGVLLPYRMVAGVNNYGLAPVGEPSPEPETSLSRVGGSDHHLPLKEWPFADVFAARAPDLALLFRRDLDFMGISNYAKSPVGVTTRDLDKAMKVAASEIKVASAGAALDLGAMARGEDSKRRAFGKGPLTLVWSEFGIGGGRSMCGDVPVKNAGEAGRWPHAGIYGSWEPKMDPWVGERAAPDARAYRKDFHNAALQLLASGGSAEFPLDSGYLWSLTSWDPQAVHPASRAPGGAPKSGFYDAEIAAMIKAHNEKARRA